MTADVRRLLKQQCDHGCTVMLIPNPNVHDKNAIEVHIAGVQAGWVDRIEARACVKKLRTHMKLFDNSFVPARIMLKYNQGEDQNVWALAEVVVSDLKKKAPPAPPVLLPPPDDRLYKINSIDAVLNFGRYSGQQLRNIGDPNYITWMVREKLISPELKKLWNRVNGIPRIAEKDAGEDEDDGWERE